MENLNIVELIEKNPISKLSNEYNNKLLNKIKNNFGEYEQQLFISSFYCYLNYDKNIDFVIDLDNIWKWLGFQQKVKSISLLEKNFKIDIDYKNISFDIFNEINEENIIKLEDTEKDIINDESDLNNKKIYKKHGGHNVKKIFLTIKCFKSFCLKAQTQKASEIHEYYMKLEEVLQETIQEETDELRLQLEKKDNIILEIKESAEKEKKELKIEKQREIEKAIISQFPQNTECVYIGTIDNTNGFGEKLIKFGNSNNLNQRVLDHRKDYNNFNLIEAFRVQNKVEIENLIRNYPKIKNNIRSIEVRGKSKTELIAYDDTYFTINKIKKYIKDIIHSKTYSIDNFNQLLKRNDELENDNRELREKDKLNKKIIEEQDLKIKDLSEIIKKQEKTIEITKIESECVYKNEILPEDDITKRFSEFISTACIVRPDVEESSTNIEGQFRIWSKTRPKKEIFHLLKNYLDTRFKAARISNQNKNQIVHGYIGVKLKEIEYKKRYKNDDVETFIFQACQFTPSGKILYSTLLTEYHRWKKSVNKEYSYSDLDDIKKYLNSSEHVIRATVWIDNTSNEGYYGLSLKCNEFKYKTTSSTGKKVTKIELSTGNILQTWETIAKAAQYENISTAKMSRSIKNKTIFNDYYYTANCLNITFDEESITENTVESTVENKVENTVENTVENNTNEL